MKFLYVVMFFIGLSLSCYAQTYQIKGSLQDTLDNPLVYATVLLLDKADSTMIDYGRSELDGTFKFKKVALGEYLIKTTYIGYIPLTVDASSANGENLELGTLQMTEIAAELMEVVIKAAKAPIKMRGDTIEYDASTFKVPDGSTVEDLLRKLPGLEVEADGSINADGKAVNRVTVDGKSFFGGDPKAATKNLPAEGISKVQVFDTKSEQEEITGAASTTQEKTMNLELKEDFKSGGFGKVIAGAGTATRREVKGNYNKFNSKMQFSLVGVGNNTGRNGLNWNDYQDFLGSQSFDFSGNYDYGFGSGGRNFIRFGGSNGIESSIQSIFFNGRRNSGFPENYNGGVNFNYDHNKLKVSSVYYYNQAGLKSYTTRSSDRFYNEFVQQNESVSENDDVSKGHRVEVVVEKEIDSLHTIKFELNGAIIDQDNQGLTNTELSRNKSLSNIATYNNQRNTNGHLGNGIIAFRKKFKKKGRRMGINASYLTTELNTDWIQDSRTDFLDEAGAVERSLLINQNNINTADKSVIKANALYVEPISKKIFFQTFANYSDRSETGDRQVSDIEGGTQVVNAFLSRNYQNEIRLGRLGSSLRYSHEGYNVSIGLAYQSFDLSGVFSSLSGELSGTVDKVFNNWIPNLSINLSPNRNTRINIGFSRSAQEPSIDDLQPLVDNTNPLYIREGNPALVPEISNGMNMYISRSYPASSIRMSLNGRINFFDSQFSTDETVDDLFVTTTKPINIEGGMDASIWMNISFPILKNKIKGRVSFSPNFSNRPAIVNGVENVTRTQRYSPRASLDITPNDDLAIYLNADYSISNTSYDIMTSQDQQNKNLGLSAEFNTKLIGGLFLNSKYTYDNFSNDRFATNQTIPILNASIYRQFLENNAAEVRVSIYDAFNENVGFNQSAYGNIVSKSSTDAIGRHVMLSVTYNIRGLKTGVRKDGWW